MYKELLHLLGAVDLDMDLPMFDTKLAGYLAQPDFHADSLKQAAEHFLDIHFTETEQPSQGTLDFDDDQVEEDPNEHRLRDLAIIRSLAVTLGPIIDEREQCWLMRAIELPVSRVLHGMEHTGAKVDSVRLVSMRDQFAAEARQAQEMAWEYAGTEINLQSPKQLQKVLFEDMGLKPTNAPSPAHTPRMRPHCRICMSNQWTMSGPTVSSERCCAIARSTSSSRSSKR